MNKLIALMLLFAVPVFAQQQVSLVPAAEQPQAATVQGAAAAAEEGPPLYTRWYVWAISGVATVAVVSAIVLVATTAFRNNNNGPFPDCAFAGCAGGSGGFGGNTPPPTR